MTAAVFDCVVLLQAAANSKGPAGACLALVEDGHASLFLSTAILDEAREVFARPAIRKKFPKLTEEKKESFLLKISTLATLGGWHALRYSEGRAALHCNSCNTWAPA